MGLERGLRDYGDRRKSIALAFPRYRSGLRLKWPAAAGFPNDTLHESLAKYAPELAVGSNRYVMSAEPCRKCVAPGRPKNRPGSRPIRGSVCRTVRCRALAPPLNPPVVFPLNAKLALTVNSRREEQLCQPCRPTIEIWCRESGRRARSKLQAPWQRFRFWTPPRSVFSSMAAAATPMVGLSWPPRLNVRLKRTASPLTPIGQQRSGRSEPRFVCYRLERRLPGGIPTR